MAIRPAAAATITDAGPQIHIPEQKKSKLPWIVLLAGLAGAGLVIGHIFGRVSHARVLYNKTIQDAKRIEDQLKQVAELNNRVVNALKGSSTRNQGKINYDDQLIKDLSQIQTSPLANPEGLKRLENGLFRTNYAMMDDLLIHRLFSCYNHFMRLVLALQNFTEEAESSKEQIVTYAQGAANADKTYGIVVAEDKGSFFIGRLVEVGPTVCADKKAMAAGQCKAADVTGFQVRIPGSSRWSEKIGRPEAKGTPLGMVVPIAPDETWQSVATAKPGYLDYLGYTQRYRSITGISAMLLQEQKALLESLKVQAAREPLFVL